MMRFTSILVVAMIEFGSMITKFADKLEHALEIVLDRIYRMLVRNRPLVIILTSMLFVIGWILLIAHIEYQFEEHVCMWRIVKHVKQTPSMLLALLILVLVVLVVVVLLAASIAIAITPFVCATCGVAHAIGGLCYYVWLEKWT
jgi:hypothetical protein